MEDIEPAWRHDGQEIAFSRVLGPGEKDIFVIKPDGTGERRGHVHPKEDHDATYSPNGDQLVITSAQTSRRRTATCTRSASPTSPT